MKPEQVAARFDDRAGYSLVDFEEVGLPAYRLTTTVLTLQPKHYGPIDEFILRAVDTGLVTVDDLSGFLGVGERVIEASATALIREDELVERQGGVLALTSKSKQVLAGEAVVRPREQALVFHYDALTRRPMNARDLRLLAPRELRDRGIREIRSYPQRRPEPDEIDIDELQSALRSEFGRKEERFQILRVQSVMRGAALFLPAVMLMYRGEAGDEVRVSFAIDDRLSENHERAFLEAGGPIRSGVAQAILSSAPKPTLGQLIGPLLAEEVEKAEKTSAGPSARDRRAAIAQLKLEIASKRGGTLPKVADDPEPFALARPVPVYEHPGLLEAALEDAKRRVIIISPWITDAVVDTGFLRRLRLCLSRGVDIYVGYGIAGPDEQQTVAARELQKIAQEDHRLRFVRLGDTHAKVLIKDEEWFVTTSFNWLSFRGDPKRPFREEWGTQVSIRAVVASYAKEVLQRFEAVLP